MIQMKGVLYAPDSAGKIVGKEIVIDVENETGIIETILNSTDSKFLKDGIRIDSTRPIAIHTADGALRIHTVEDDGGIEYFSSINGIFNEKFARMVRTIQAIVGCPV